MGTDRCPDLVHLGGRRWDEKKQMSTTFFISFLRDGAAGKVLSQQHFIHTLLCRWIDKGELALVFEETRDHAGGSHHETAGFQPAVDTGVTFSLAACSVYLDKDYN